MDVPLEFDPNFEPQIRERSNTWPCRPREEVTEGSQSSPASDEAGSGEHAREGLGLNKKTSSRRNAWGNLSYADLITKAIQSSTEQRLTLSQIYDWMVQNVPYFKDKGDSTSSAGWKNSIRHNLSLHSRFMRIQNEGTGKSSWWVINPDAKPGKTPRRRAGSMETKSYEKKRGRLKKRVELLRAAENNGSLSSEDLDFHGLHQLSPEFRTRAGSNASSCGRLSPIQAAAEPDLHDNQVPPMSPIPWTDIDTDDNFNSSDSLVQTLIGSMNSANLGMTPDQEMAIMESNIKQELLSGGTMTQYQSQNSGQNIGQFREDGQFRNLPAPPSYTDHLQQQQQQHSRSQQGSPLNMGMQNQNNLSPMFSDDPFRDGLLMSQNILNSGSNSLRVNTQQLNSPGRSPQLSPHYNNQRAGYVSDQGSHSPQPIKRVSPSPLANNHQQMNTGPPPPQQTLNNRSLLQQCLESPSDSLLRAALTQTTQFQQCAVTAHQQQHYQQQQQQQQQQFNNMYVNSPVHNSINNNSMGPPPPPVLSVSQQSNPLTGSVTGGSNNMLIPPRNISNPSLADIDTDSMLDLDYDVEQLLRHELSIDSNLDFNFDSSSSNSGMGSVDSKNLVR